jgi:type IX secretion system substrate protein
MRTTYRIHRLARVVFISCFLSLYACFCTAQTPYVAIPDSNFVHYLKLIIPTAFKGDSLNKTSTLVTTTTQTINCNHISIANLSGVQYFTSLTNLNCSNNYSLTTLPVLPNTLTSLDCGGNHLTSLPALPDSLTFLACGSNSLTTLPVLPNSLTYLDCGYNSLTTLPALPNFLQSLWSEENNIACFPIFPNSITAIYIDANPYNCLPNHIPAMGSDTTKPLCAAGNSNGCAVAGIEQYNTNNNVSVYPNPAKDVLNVECLMLNANSTLVITDMMGNTIYHSIFTTQHSTINVAGLSEGVYNLSITTNAGEVNKRVVIVR